MNFFSILRMPSHATSAFFFFLLAVPFFSRLQKLSFSTMNNADMT